MENIDVRGFAPKVNKRIAAIAQKCARFAPWWCQSLHIDIDRNNTDGGMSCSPQKHYRAMHILISDTLLAEDDETISAFLLHEIAHGHNEPILNVVWNYMETFIENEGLRDTFRKIVEREVEAQTEDLRILFSGLNNE